jgi:hypothetical protein
MRHLVVSLALAMLLCPANGYAQGGDTLVPGGLKLTATFNSIGVEVFFASDDDANASAGLEFRRSGDASWRTGLPLWRTNDGSASPGAAFYGSALLLDPGVTYEVRVTLMDPDGVAGNAVLTGEIKTRVDDIADVASLVPTHYVAPNGNDANDGTSSAHAWQSLDTVFKVAPPGAVVEVAPGFYPAPAARTVRTTPITLKARNPAAVEQSQVIGGESRRVATEANPNARSVVEPRGSDSGPAVSAPAGAADPDLVGRTINRIAPWQQVTFQGVVDPTQSYTVWKWTASPAPWVAEMSVSPTRGGAGNRVTNWAASGDFLNTPQKWAEQVYTHPDWQNGFWASKTKDAHFVDENGQDATTNLDDIYVRLAGDADPNQSYVTVSSYGESGLAIDGPNVRVSGLEFRTVFLGVELRAHATNAVVDGCVFQIGVVGLAVNGIRTRDGSPSSYGSDHVVQTNVFHGYGVTPSDNDPRSAVPWHFIKDSPARIGGYSETSGIAGGGGARRMVIRRNTFEGTFDGFGGFHEGYDRYSMQDADITSNLFRNLADDGLDLARGTINNRVWDNRFERVIDVLSVAAPTYGPVYFFHNEGWRFGNHTTAATADGQLPAGEAVKYGSVNYANKPPAARVYLVQNTFWSDQTSWAPAEGIMPYGAGGKEQPFFYIRDNLVRVPDKAFRVVVPERWDEDGNDFSSSRTDQPAVDGQLMDPANGDLRPRPGSALTGRGVPVANIADRPGVDFKGRAPDVGNP